MSKSLETKSHPMSLRNQVSVDATIAMPLYDVVNGIERNEVFSEGDPGVGF
jgi:hypothetical protein